MVSLDVLRGKPLTNKVELSAMSKDELPTNAKDGINGILIANGSTAFIIDTGNVFAFDEETDTWIGI